MPTLEINPHRSLHKRDINIYGQFLEHFHRQIYGGIFEPGSPLADEHGFRKDVLEALRRLNIPLIRWPGGCFVSAYHWKDGIGKERTPVFDKAWRVEEPNTFGTDEFIRFCRELNTEPYLCGNAGTGSPEEMSDWVEYCNLESEGRWAKARIANGFKEPHKVKYWSIGNENYGHWEMGAKDALEWNRYVTETAKMMRRVDPSIEILVPFTEIIDWTDTHTINAHHMRLLTSSLEWNLNLLREAAPYLDWISVHGYWDAPSYAGDLSGYDSCMVATTLIEKKILKAKHLLGVMGYLGKLRIAFDEWNLRGWYHPNMHGFTPEEIAARDKNDDNSSYTMADAVFSACFLNQCLKHADTVGMANFSPTVNTRGLLFTHPEGIVLRSTYFVFELYAKYMQDTVVDYWLDSSDSFEVSHKGKTHAVPDLDVMATRDSTSQKLAVSLVNRHPDKRLTLELTLREAGYSKAALYRLEGPSKDAYNEITRPDTVKVVAEELNLEAGARVSMQLAPHSVNVLTLE